MTTTFGVSYVTSVNNVIVFGADSGMTVNAAQRPNTGNPLSGEFNLIMIVSELIDDGPQPVASTL